MAKLPIEQYLIEAFKRNKCKQVHNEVSKLAEELIRRCWKENVFIVFTDGLRTLENQAVIYGKGRSSFIYRGKQYGDLKAKKVSNAKPGTSFHNYGLALDFLTCDGYGKNIDWIVGPKWRRAAAIAKELGFTWGGDWASFRDYPHIQYDGGLTIGQVQKGQLPSFKSDNVSRSVIAPDKQTKITGTVEVLVANLNVRKDADFNSKIVKVVTKGSRWKCYGEKNGLYNIGGNQWVTAGIKYTKFVKI